MRLCLGFRLGCACGFRWDWVCGFRWGCALDSDEAVFADQDVAVLVDSVKAEVGYVDLTVDIDLQKFEYIIGWCEIKLSKSYC